VNFALHAVATLTLWWTLLTISDPRKGTGAWIGAALFAVHPLGTEAVLWAVGRAEILAALFGMVAFVLFVRRSIALSVAAFFAALCFKESAATWLVIGAAWIALRPAESRPPAKLVARQASCYVAAFAVFYALRASAVGWGHATPHFVDNPLVGVDSVTRAANAVLLFGGYAAKMLWPQALSVEYGFAQIPVVPLLPWGALSAVTTAAAVVAMVVTLRRRGHPTAAFLAAFVPCAFAVTGNLVFPIGTIFAERLAYLPLAGFCGLFGLALAAIPKPAWRAAAVGVLLGACIARTNARGGDYRDLAALTEATAAASPRAVKTLSNAGRTRLRQGRADLAVPLLERAVGIWPDYARGWALLAEAYAASGDELRAQDAKRRANEALSQASSDDEPL
jgi:tetratricopeptide (TPR) repeat protein